MRTAVKEYEDEINKNERGSFCILIFDVLHGILQKLLLTHQFCILLHP